MNNIENNVNEIKKAVPVDSRPESQTEQDALMNIQFAHAKETRKIDIITTVILCAFIFGLSILMFIMPDVSFSEQENRYLQQSPKFTIERLISGEFTAEISEYFADQFPLRDFFVGLKGGAEIAQGKGENNNVTLGKDGYIITRDDYPSKDILKKNAEGIIAFADAMEKLGDPYIVAFAGRPSDVLFPYLPANYPHDRVSDSWDYFVKLIKADDYITFVDLKSPIAEEISKNYMNDDDKGENQLLYRTDHHWTSFGAYVGYREIVRAMGVEPKEFDFFNPELVSDEFYGTTWSSAGMKWIEPDEMYYLRYEGDDSDYVTTIVDTNTSFNGFYDESYLDKKDKYASFISGNNALVTIEKVNNVEEGRQKILLVKDSYAHSLAPLLAVHFDLVIVDLRYYKESTINLYVEENCDQALVMSYLGSVCEANVFEMFKLGLKSFLAKN